jgi:hypothetical protein
LVSPFDRVSLQANTHIVTRERVGCKRKAFSLDKLGFRSPSRPAFAVH